MADEQSQNPSDVTRLASELEDLYADAPDLAKTALKNVIRDNAEHLAAPASRMESAGRAGSRQGKVSEFTLILPLAPGGAHRLRELLKKLHGNFQGAELVGTVHDMRFVFLDDDTKLLFATAFDGDWDSYVTDFATKIPDIMDVLFSAFDGWPGIRDPSIRDYIDKYQVTAEGWYVANPDLTVVETRRLKRVGEAVDEFLDKVGE